MINKHFVEVKRTARYFTLGEFSEKTKTVWFVLHGYAQTADAFLESLQTLKTEDNIIIAPEGLSKFYWKDFTSNPVASWMTRLEREQEIKDSINYLNQVYQTIFTDKNPDSFQINYLGFSQGAPTLSRWLHLSKMKVDNIFFYAGEIGHDLDFNKNESPLTKGSKHFIYGEQDRFISKEKFAIFKNFMTQMNVEFKVFTFEGKHEIHTDALAYIQTQIKQ
ncbi:MAG: alpha/beta hydrolase [Chitinophagales bacterium]